MTRSVVDLKKKNERSRARRSGLPSAQFEIEERAIRLRARLRISEYQYLPHEAALGLIPNCEVWALKNIPGITLEDLVHFRTGGYHIGAMAFRVDDSVMIAFNDAHPAPAVRVNLMEEFFHVWLGHRPDVLRVYPLNQGSHRRHDPMKEEEAYGCAIAALVPFAGLEAMLARGEHVARIAEHFCVPVDVVMLRISVTQMGDLANARERQLALLASFDMV